MKRSRLFEVPLAGGRQARSTTRKSRYIAVLSAKTAPTPARAMTTPATAGTAALARLMLIDDSADAACSCGRGTRSGTIDWYAGSTSTDPQPIRKGKVSKSAGGIWPAQG